jgi:hypothetical protein
VPGLPSGVEAAEKKTLRRLAALLLIFAAAVPGRDWHEYPAILRVQTTETIFVVGDVHGDYARLARLLQAGGVVDPQARWSSGKAVLVFDGDMIDKGPRPVDVLQLVVKLAHEAGQEGGRVVPLMGNHEAEFLAGPHAKKSTDFLKDLHRRGLGDTAFNQLLAALPFGARVNDWFFCHAGNTAGRTLAQLDADLEAGVTHQGFSTPQLLAPDSLLEARLGAANWFGSKDEKQRLTSYAQALGVQHIVQGHQHGGVRFADGVERHAGEMFQRYGILFLTDVGMSEGVNDSRGALLRIRGGAADAICPDGRITRLWDAGSRQDAGRAFCH